MSLLEALWPVVACLVLLWLGRRWHRERCAGCEKQEAKTDRHEKAALAELVATLEQRRNQRLKRRGRK